MSFEVVSAALVVTEPTFGDGPVLEASAGAALGASAGAAIAVGGGAAGTARLRLERRAAFEGSESRLARARLVKNFEADLAATLAAASSWR